MRVLYPELLINNQLIYSMHNLFSENIRILRIQITLNKYNKCMFSRMLFDQLSSNYTYLPIICYCAVMTFFMHNFFCVCVCAFGLAPFCELCNIILFHILSTNHAHVSLICMSLFIFRCYNQPKIS